ncbi:MAG: MgtC/SapB family protein [Spirochaetia bacterium]|jgi:putative Mg2+ transporter-C (MgtC) family protein|nr:MgtC/SapB family protein [Spirochaetia bacterium]
MDIFNDLDVNAATSALRLFLSLIAGGLIGFERESRRQPAGLRTHILISVGSTLLMLLSIYLPQSLLDMKNGDPGRIAAQVVSGVGFLGAGAIIKLGNNVKGLTTAASIWVIAGIGLAIGAGLYIPSLIAVLIILFTLFVLNHIEKYIFPPERNKAINLYFEGLSVDTETIKVLLKKYCIKIEYVDVIQAIQKKKVQVKMLVKIPISLNIPFLYKELRHLPQIYKIEMDEGI